MVVVGKACLEFIWRDNIGIHLHPSPLGYDSRFRGYASQPLVTYGKDVEIAVCTLRAACSRAIYEDYRTGTIRKCFRKLRTRTRSLLD